MRKMGIRMQIHVPEALLARFEFTNDKCQIFDDQFSILFIGGCRVALCASPGRDRVATQEDASSATCVIGESSGAWGSVRIWSRNNSDN